ncbi:hypothetical protein BCR44DRAFT_1423747 [Catenaria anguillulae PL171]|uniref:Uncharacterized protein n=1 Tax=Catenaria anguillulae PL171 TaxID=765915 RepID=A0A1Y2I5G5_9FUNG|nr:hypothetical protein BCR44DRAFT_1423747 [Catenaria anguillulae PL171]
MGGAKVANAHVPTNSFSSSAPKARLKSNNNRLTDTSSSLTPRQNRSNTSPVVLSNSTVTGFKYRTPSRLTRHATCFVSMASRHRFAITFNMADCRSEKSDSPLAPPITSTHNPAPNARASMGRSVTLISGSASRKTRASTADWQMVTPTPICLSMILCSQAVTNRAWSADENGGSASKTSVASVLSDQPWRLASRYCVRSSTGSCSSERRAPHTAGDGAASGSRVNAV